jgi:signal transduction histidine kinase
MLPIDIDAQRNMDPKKNSYCPMPGRPLHGEHRHWRGSMRHTFFFKVFVVCAIVCGALTLTCTLNEGVFSLKRFFHYAGYIFLSFFVLLLILRQMFKPMRWLLLGVQQITDGNLGFQFQPGRHGEINFLAAQFNLMARRVKEMVETKEQLLLDVSHELRSPLTRLKVALEMTPKSKMKDSMMTDIVEMENMLSEILETERLKGQNGKLSLEPLDLTTLVKETVQKYEAQKPGIQLLGNPGKMEIKADPARVRTVLQNVVENSLKYSTSQKKPVEIGLEKRDGGLQVTVQDFGVGIPPEEQERVFEPFYRVDKSRTKQTGGYGLGLSLCREIMRAHGGEISLESSPEKGTRVFLFFPNEKVS